MPFPTATMTNGGRLPLQRSNSISLDVDSLIEQLLSVRGELEWPDPSRCRVFLDLPSTRDRLFYSNNQPTNLETKFGRRLRRIQPHLHAHMENPDGRRFPKIGRSRDEEGRGRGRETERVCCCRVMGHVVKRFVRGSGVLRTHGPALAASKSSKSR